MKIAVASDTPGFDGMVPALFSQTPYLLIVDMESGDIADILSRFAFSGNRQAQDTALAREVLRLDCEGVLCGPIEREPFVVLADEGQITRYHAAGLAVYEALFRANARSLALIRDHIGGEGCQGEHKADAVESRCECGHHDE